MRGWADLPHVSRRVQDLRKEYSGPPTSLAGLLCDRHPDDAVAVTIAQGDGTCAQLTYAELEDASRRLATVLAESGVGPGERVAVLMGKSLDLVVTLLATWRLGAVHVPLFTAFATPAVETRLAAARPMVAVTDPDQRAKLDGIGGLTVLESGPPLRRQVAASAPWLGAHLGGLDDPFIQVYTSGTTGRPKGVAVPRRALAAFVSYLEFGLDVRADDVYWNAADPGWAYGLYFGVVAPLAAGRALLLSAAPFAPDTTVEVIERCGVTNFAGAPTMYRAIRQRGLSTLPLRRASSAGEPLTPEVNAWAPTAIGCEVRDHWGQTEQGMAIAHCWHDALREPLRPRSMGRGLPGFAADVIDGQLVLDTRDSPLMWFTGYVDEPERTRERFTEDGRWYRTGDAATREGDHFSFLARDDDLIIMAGYRIGPVEIESILVAHPAIAEAAVVGRPDEVRGEVLEAFVVLVPDRAGDAPETLAEQLREMVRTGYGAHAYPRRVRVVAELPKTPSGKIQRYLLRG